MTTETMEVFSLEEGDTIVCKGSLYAVSVMEATETGYRLHLTDEEGFAKILNVNDTDRIRVVVE